MEPLPAEIEAHGVVLRTWAPADAPSLHRAIVASTEHLRPWMVWIGLEPLTVAARVKLIERWERERLEGGDVVFGIWQDGVVVGGAGLHRRLGEGGLEIGYWVHIDHVGRGIATAASRAATDLAFTVAGIDRVEIHHDVVNRASGRVPAKLGYRRLPGVASPRPEAAPAETGADGIWRTTRAEWRARRAERAFVVAGQVLDMVTEPDDRPLSEMTGLSAEFAEALRNEIRADRDRGR